MEDPQRTCDMANSSYSSCELLAGVYSLAIKQRNRIVYSHAILFRVIHDGDVQTYNTQF